MNSSLFARYPVAWLIAAILLALAGVAYSQTGSAPTDGKIGISVA